MFTCCPWPPTHCPHHIHGDASETQIWLCHQWSQEYSCFLLTEQQNLLPWPIDHIDPVSYGSFRLPHPPWTKGTSLCSRHRKTRCQDLCRASSRDRTFHQLTWWMKKLFSFFLACLVLHSHGPYSVHPNAIVENYVQKNICIQSVNRIDINAKCYQSVTKDKSIEIFRFQLFKWWMSPKSQVKSMLSAHDQPDHGSDCLIKCIRFWFQNPYKRTKWNAIPWKDKVSQIQME